MPQTVTVTGRVTGPDGLGRMGRIRFTPAALGAPLPAREIVAGRVSARIDPDGRLVTPTGGDLTLKPGNYEIDLTIPGDLGAHVRTTRYLSDGQTLDLSDLLEALPPSPPPQPITPRQSISPAATAANFFDPFMKILLSALVGAYITPFCKITQPYGRRSPVEMVTKAVFALS